MKPSPKTDVIVVGTGPGGATVAREMTRRNQAVLMLEWGGNQAIKGTMPQFARAAAIPGKSFLMTPDLCGMIRGIATGGSSVFYYATAFDPPWRPLMPVASIFAPKSTRFATNCRCSPCRTT